jgi:hypothetical protein
MSELEESVKCFNTVSKLVLFGLGLPFEFRTNGSGKELTKITNVGEQMPWLSYNIRDLEPFRT